MHITAEGLWRGEFAPLMPGNFITTVDGNRVERVLEADDEEGWVVYVNEAGKPDSLEGNVRFIPMWE